MITKMKGTYDIYGDISKKREYINDVLSTLASKYNYEYIETPVFEASELFHRSVGETTDMVKKETYDFKDRGDRMITLRPEGTAGVVRWFIENKMYGNLTDAVKVFYNEKMYRYERPQSGRNREFTQWGYECFGSNDYISDVEVISLAYNAYKLLGLNNITIKINSLGDKESREEYKKSLIEYFKPHIDTLCKDCQERYKSNPLRILDCKIDNENPIFTSAPKILDYLTKEDKMRFDSILSLLDLLDIKYEVDPNLVRGLDYYNQTVFEVVLDNSNALGGGGRYNNLVSSLGGPSIPAVGFAMGYDRTLLALSDLNVNIPINDSIDCYIIYKTITEKETSLYIADNLRINGFITELDLLDKSYKAKFKSIDRFNSKYIIFVNDEVLKDNKVTVKDNKTKEEEVVNINDLVDYLDMHI